MSNKVEYVISLKDLLSARLNDAERSVRLLDSSVNSVNSSLGRLGAMAGLAFGGAAITKGLMSIVDAGSKVENATTGLTTMLKDVGKAREVISNTMEDATKTPFEYESLLMANKALISANVSAKDARQTVLDLSNAIAATGGGNDELTRMVVNLQQIKNVGTATAVDIKQFAIAGVNIYEILARATGKTAAQVKDLDVSYDLLTMALHKAHEAGGIYAGGLENMAGNTSVRISNISDAVFQLKVKMFNDLKPAIDTIVQGLSDFVGWLGQAWNWLLQNREMLLGVAKGILVGVAAYKSFILAQKAAIIVTKIQELSVIKLGFAYRTAGGFQKFFIGGLQAIKTALLSNPVTLALTAITSLATAYFAFSGAAKDATRENDKLNKSLLETALSAREASNKVVYDLYDSYKERIKDFDKSGNAIMMSERERMAAFNKERERNIENLTYQLEGLYDKFPSLKDPTLMDFSKSREEMKKAREEASRLQGAIGSLQNWEQIVKNRDAAAAGTDPTKTIPVKSKKETSGAVGNKSVSVHIDINNLINDFTIKTNTVNESANKIKEIVVQALLSAVNNSQIVLGQ